MALPESIAMLLKDCMDSPVLVDGLELFSTRRASLHLECSMVDLLSSYGGLSFVFVHKLHPSLGLTMTLFGCTLPQSSH